MLVTTTVGFEELRVSCIIGVLPEERVKEQDLLMDLEVQLTHGLEEGPEGASYLDYTGLSAHCTQLAQEGKFELLEDLGACIVGSLMQDPRVAGVRIKLAKPAALPQANAAVVTVAQGM
jgi:dihydroneopterin aldolase